MNTMTSNFLPRAVEVDFPVKSGGIIKKLLPRRCTVVSTLLIFAGMSIPALMTIDLLPASLFLGFVGFALVAGGGVLTLIFCGEI